MGFGNLMARSKLSSVVECHRSHRLVRCFLQSLIQTVCDMIRILGLNLLHGQQASRAVNHRDDSACAWRAEDRVAFKVAMTSALFDDLRPIGDPLVFGPRRRFSPHRSLPASPKVAFPHGLVLILPDPCVDCCGGNPMCRVSWEVAPLPTTYLIWRPVLVQTSLNGTADLRTIHFPFERTVLPPLTGFVMRLRSIVLSLVRAVPFQLTRDHRSMPVHHLGNRRLTESSRPQISYPVTFFQRKMPCHRRDSVPKGSALDTVLGNSRHGFSGRPISFTTLTGIPCISVL
jgi:hypothetical protein